MKAISRARAHWRRHLPFVAALGVMCLSPREGRAECVGQTVPCVSATERGQPAQIDANHAYTLVELIDIAERSNPQTQTYLELAAQRASQVRSAQSEYFPTVVAEVRGGDELFVTVPFPKSMVPDGYVTVQTPYITPQLSARYLLVDLGRRARVEQAKLVKLATDLQLLRENQQVAFGVGASFCNLVTRQEALEAAKQILATAQTTQEAAEGRRDHGCATLPDVLNARAATAQADFDLQSATGEETMAHIALMEAVGAEPSPYIQIERPAELEHAREMELSVSKLIDQALRDRPDLQAAIAMLRAESAGIREAESAYFPTLSASASGSRTWEWAISDFGQAGPTNVWPWALSLGLEWTVFDGGLRKSKLEEAASRDRAARSELRGEHD